MTPQQQQIIESNFAAIIKVVGVIVERLAGIFGIDKKDYNTKDEMKAAAMQATISAAKKYDPNRGVRFTTFAYRGMKGAAVRVILAKRKTRGREWSFVGKFDGDEIMFDPGENLKRGSGRRIDWSELIKLCDGNVSKDDLRLIVLRAGGFTSTEIAVREKKTLARTQQRITFTQNKIGRLLKRRGFRVDDLWMPGVGQDYTPPRRSTKGPICDK